MRLCALLCLVASGCFATGIRQIPRPTSNAGYRRIDARDIGMLGLKDVYVDFDVAVGVVAPSGDACNGLVTVMGMAGFGTPAVQLTLSRARWPEVRDLKTFERIRVRGYVSDTQAEGCSGDYDTTNRYVWVDSLEKL